MTTTVPGTVTGILRDASVTDAVAYLVGDTPYAAFYGTAGDRRGLLAVRVGEELVEQDLGGDPAPASAMTIPRASYEKFPDSASEVDTRLLYEWQAAHVEAYIEINSSYPAERILGLESVDAEGGALVMLDGMIEYDTDPDVRIAVLEKLAESESRIAYESILKGLADPDPRVIIMAVTIVEDWGDEEIIPRYLEPLLSHPDADVRERVAEIIESSE